MKHKCTKCGETDPDKFGVDKHKPSGLNIWCRQCWKKYRSNLNKDRIKKINQRHYSLKRERRLESRIKIIEYLKSHPCVVCGENDPIVLCFDHLNPETKIATVSLMVSRYAYRWEKIKNEISKCQVLCANCHTRKTAKQQGWYNLTDKHCLSSSERIVRGQHMKPPSGKSSKYKGVSFKKKNNKWVATIVVNYKNIYLGSFDIERDAALAYNQAAIKYFGGNTYINPVPKHKNSRVSNKEGRCLQQLK